MRKGGFTLMETIFSTLFISLTVLAIVNLFPGAYLSVKKSEVQLQADSLANYYIEGLRALSWGELEELEKSGEVTNADVTIDGVTYYSTVAVREEDDALKHVKVEIFLRISGGANGFNKLNPSDEPLTVHETYFHSRFR